MRVTMEGCVFLDAMVFTANAYQVSLGQDVKVSDSEARKVTVLLRTCTVPLVPACCADDGSQLRRKVI